MASTNTMLRQCSGLIGTNDITDWENNFLKSLMARSKDGTRPDLLSPAQVETLENIHAKHFAG
jgi:hypothetical protein